MKCRGEYKHLGVPGPNFDWDYPRLYNPCMVYDRFHLGALVYGYIMNLHEVPNRLVQLIDKVNSWLEHGTTLIVVHTSDEEWYWDHLKRNGKKEEFAVDQIMMANRLFPIIAPQWAKKVDIQDGRFERIQEACHQFIDSAGGDSL